ncbi:MAG: TonB-dependent siderophore receptor, partial [Sphingomonadales bacterium]
MLLRITLNSDTAPSTTKTLGGMTVTSSAIDEPSLKVEKLASPRYTRPILDTPQTITVINAASMQQQNLLSLTDVLSTVPGITFGAGEGGGGYGDSINLRGYAASNDITVDGVRDSAQYTRSDTFNIEQVEVANGANSVFNGSGSVGGTINLVSKAARAEDFANLTDGLGSDSYYRATVDANHQLADDVAFRLNGMWHQNDVAGRKVESFERWGIAPSISIGLDGPTSATLSYFHQEDDNIPLY